MKTASLIQFSGMIFQLAFTLAQLPAHLSPPRPPPRRALTPLAPSPVVWLAPTGVLGRLTRVAMMARHTVDLLCLVLARLVASSSSGLPVCCACRMKLHTHTHVPHTHVRACALAVPVMLTGAELILSHQATLVELRPLAVTPARLPQPLPRRTSALRHSFTPLPHLLLHKVMDG